MMDSYLFQKEVNPEEHIIATYKVQSRELLSATRAIAIGQSIGNPNVRTPRDSPRMMKDHLAKILSDPSQVSSSEGIVRVAFPLANFGRGDGITQLLCTLMGGQMDIDLIERCRLTDVQFPQTYMEYYQGPKFGMADIKKRTNAITRPLLGGIIKPKTGMTVSQLKGLVKELLDGGVDFIKEDEILGNPPCCPFEERVPRIVELVNNSAEKHGREIFYAPCINGDYPVFLERARFAAEAGAKVVHLNIWAGLPAYKALRDLDLLNTSIFFQKSGDKVMTDQQHRFGIDWPVMCKLARMYGADFIHAGMWGGYLSDYKERLEQVFTALTREGPYKQTLPSLSCGSHPGLVDTTRYHFGDDLMMNVGGAIQGHPMGTTAGAVAMRQAMDKPVGKDMFSYMQDKQELRLSIEKWGYVHPETGEILYKK